MFVTGLTLPQLAAIFTILGVTLGLLKPIRQSIFNVWKKTFGRRGAQLDRIEDELKPNSGSSLRDVVDQIARKQSDFDAFLSASLNIHEEAVFRTDAEGHVIFTNRAHQRLTGFSTGEAYGEGWVNYLAPYERDRMQKTWREVVATGRELNETITFIRPDGEEYDVRAHVYRERDKNGSIRGYLGIIYPIDKATGCPHRHKCVDDLRELLHV